MRPRHICLWAAGLLLLGGRAAGFAGEPAGVADAAHPDFGPNVLMFDPAMPMAAIQKQLAAVYNNPNDTEFGSGRFALCFKPGLYTNLDVNLGFYTQVIGLGQMPDDVVISGNVHAEGEADNQDNATCNFWRSCENLAVAPTNGSPMTWAVSQGTALRRLHVRGGLNLADTGFRAYASGGFLADSVIDTVVDSLTQQQWLSRNVAWGEWAGQNWNMVFVGVTRPPPGTWPNPPYTVITNTPVIREKPYLCLDAQSNFEVFVPALATNSIGPSWAAGPTPGTAVPLRQFYLAHAGVDNDATINAALGAGLNLILTPGIYQITNSIVVNRADTIILGLGFPTLVSAGPNPALVIADVPGVNLSDIIFDTGRRGSPALLEIGTGTNSLDHSADPICLADITCRVGGATPGRTTACIVINANEVIGENLWLWRADHGAGVGWNRNVSHNGLVVNGNDVMLYGLFVEHHEQYQTLWNGNDGRVYLYQSELPYDAPSQPVWSHDGVNGYASYKVADTVTSHQGYGLGVYGVFLNSRTKCFNAYEIPADAPGVNLHDVLNVYIIGKSGSEMTHVINGTGTTLTTGVTTATVSYWRPGTEPGVRVGTDATITRLALGLPSGIWPNWQRRYGLPGADPVGSVFDRLPHAKGQRF